MRRKLLLLAVVLFVTAFTAEMAMTNSGGPPLGHTGAPSESDCTACHSSFTVNSGTGTRTLVLNSNAGLTSYTPGQTYTVTYTINQSGITKFGFQATVKRANGTSAGTLINSNPNQMNLASNYISQSGSGTTATSAGERIWTFGWTAPAAGAGTVTIYVAGNATNSNSSTSGDRIYTNSFAFTEAASPAVVNAATFAPAAICRGGSINVNFSITGTFNSGNIFTAQLSDANGNFAAPITIGTVSSTTASAIAATIPVGASGGTAYKIRVVASNPVATGTASTASLIVTVPASAPTVAYNGRTLTASGNGAFVWFRNGNQIAGASGATFVPTQDGNYTAAIENNGCSPSLSSSIAVTAGILSVQQPATPVICAETGLLLSFTTFGTFNVANIFTLVLIDSVGAETLLNTTTLPSNSLLALLPAGITGNGFRYRLQASNPVAITASSNTFGIIPNPPAATITRNGLVLSSSASQFNAWYKDGSPIIGANQPTYTVIENGEYSVRYSANNCQSPFSNSITLTTVSMDELILSQVNVYPNPVRDELFVNSPEALTLELRDMQGKLVYHSATFTGEHRISVAQYAKGIYTLRLKRENAVRFEKIVVQ